MGLHQKYNEIESPCRTAPDHFWKANTQHHPTAVEVEVSHKLKCVESALPIRLQGLGIQVDVAMDPQLDANRIITIQGRSLGVGQSSAVCHGNWNHTLALFSA